jgi:hypothetical protein
MRAANDARLGFWRYLLCGVTARGVKVGVDADRLCRPRLCVPPDWIKVKNPDAPSMDFAMLSVSQRTCSSGDFDCMAIATHAARNRRYSSGQSMPSSAAAYLL